MAQSTTKLRVAIPARLSMQRAIELHPDGLYLQIRKNSLVLMRNCGGLGEVARNLRGDFCDLTDEANFRRFMDMGLEKRTEVINQMVGYVSADTYILGNLCVHGQTDPLINVTSMSKHLMRKGIGYVEECEQIEGLTPHRVYLNGGIAGVNVGLIPLQS